MFANFFCCNNCDDHDNEQGAHALTSLSLFHWNWGEGESLRNNINIMIIIFISLDFSRFQSVEYPKNFPLKQRFQCTQVIFSLLFSFLVSNYGRNLERNVYRDPFSNDDKKVEWHNWNT